MLVEAQFASPDRAWPKASSTLSSLSFICLTAVLLSAPALAAAPDGVRAVLTGPSVPYHEVVYEIAEKQGTVVATVVKRFAADFGRRDAVALVPTDEWETLLDRLEAAGLFSLPDATDGPPPRAVWRVEARRGGKAHRFVVHDPATRPDGRHLALIDGIREAVSARTEALPFIDALLLPAESGQLRVRSQPSARVAVDGLPVEGTTPLSGLPLLVGAHAIRLTPAAGGAAQTYDVRIERGKTTSLVVELK